MEWSNEKTLEFLSLFEKESLIWNPKDPMHKNRNLVSDAWKRIKDNFSEDIAIEELKKKDSLMANRNNGHWLKK
ncbi:uncharacterized protein LOC111029458 [Myzus persicae]|uniref:uncharacterized protein LOC111029458 n=1 Tax=Myzus persicae TaxID=13164 RepID=UPI000B92FA2B|nr:uncharacterized protein LOC111029458 [Myzus persicae]